MQLHQEISGEEMQQRIDTEIEVLIERENRDNGYLKGRSRCWKKVIFPGDQKLIGTLQKVKITGCNHQTLVGELVSSASKTLAEPLFSIS